MGLGICMDLNPYQFKTPFTDFEFANFQLEQGATLIVISMAWLLAPQQDSESDDEDDHIATTPCWSTIKYWVMRLTPLVRSTEGPQGGRVVVVVSNRFGTEGGPYVLLYPSPWNQSGPDEVR